jgi:hypothetical protein
MKIVYRACGSSNRKRRPAYFSKWSCLMSFARAIQGVDDVSVTFICDGDMPGGVLATMRALGDVEQLSGVGNSKSYLVCVSHVVHGRVSDDAIVHICEDDYLYLATALKTLQDAGPEIGERTYVTLYDHPDRYRRSDDLPVPGNVAQFGGVAWRRVESTNMTYATMAGTLRRDYRLHRLFSAHTSYPHDREMWRTIQGLGVRRPMRWLRSRALFGAFPSLATHVESEQLAPGIDWAQLAQEATDWAEQQMFEAAREW